MEIDHRTVSQKPIEAHFCTRHTIIIEKQQKGIPIQTRFGWGFPFFLKKDRRKCEMYPLYWTPSKEGTFCVIRLNLS